MYILCIHIYIWVTRLLYLEQFTSVSDPSAATPTGHFLSMYILSIVDGFNPFEKYHWPNWSISPSRGENKRIFETTSYIAKFLEHLSC